MPREKPPKTATPYDLTTPSPIAVGRLPALERAYDRFCRSAKITLSRAFKKPATLSLISTDALRFGDLTSSLPWPSAAAILHFEGGLSGTGLIIMDSKLVFRIVELSFGGAKRGESTRESVEDFTRIELSVAQTAVTTLLPDLSQAWSALAPTKISFERIESRPDLIERPSPPDVVVSTTFDVAIDNVRGVLCVVLEHSMLKPLEARA